MIKVRIIIFSLILFVTGLVLAAVFLRKTKGSKHWFSILLVYLYAPMSLWSAVYFLVCLRYAGIHLSMVWLWPALALFGLMRMIMLRAEIKDKPLIKIPRVIRYIYRGAFVAVLLLFLTVEGLIVDAMTGVPEKNLDYVIVLGAGLIGDKPTNPLKVRIDKAAEYMAENPRTILIASGGQGADEKISEAECIKRSLVERGIAEERILMEDRSTSTEENLRYSRKIIGDADAAVGIITNGFHEYRAGMIAENEGFTNAYSVPATTLLPVGIHYTIREFFGVVHFMIKYG
ncbi:MAG: YdcF family protein [Lachnospiraceae bacterium]|nr:YdcF family protein [Lachnospiraceae bacterium]